MVIIKKAILWDILMTMEFIGHTLVKDLMVETNGRVDKNAVVSKHDCVTHEVT